ncbi:MAG: hypothetical protein ACP5TI_04295 [Thermoprotei archaeon]
MQDKNKKIIYVILIFVFLIGAVAVSFVNLPNANYFVLDPYLSLPAAVTGDEFNVSFNVFPTPMSSPPSTVSISVGPGLKLISGVTEALEPGPAGSKKATWEVEANSSGMRAVDFKLGSQTYRYDFPVYPQLSLTVATALPKLGDGVTPLNGGLALKTGSEAVYFEKSSLGYGPAIVFFINDGSALPMGILPALGSACYSSNSWDYAELVPQFASWNNRSINFVFNGSAVTFRSYWEIENGTVFVRNRLIASKPLGLNQFSFSLYAGAFSFGQSKEQALFPGLEWLVGNESSSSTLDVAPPYNLRDAPDPDEVTVPLMAVSEEGGVVGLLWGPSFSWNGLPSDVLSPEFSVPNWLQGQDDDLFELFVPNVPQYVQPNEDQAFSSYTMASGSSVSIECAVYAGPGNALGAVNEWVRVFGMPKPDLPMAPSQDINYSMKAYLSSLWVKGQGWLPWNTFSNAYPNSGAVGTIYLASLVEKNLTLRAQLLSLFNETLPMAVEYGGPGYLISPDGNEGPPVPAISPLPFYVGYMNASLAYLRAMAYPYASAINASGGLLQWEPTSTTKDLGVPGERKLGTTSDAAAIVLTYAKITGDRAALSAGIKALNSMEVFRVPRAGQTWEVPVHAPEIFSDAEAVYDYVLGYQLTGNSTYLAEADYWAEAGLPFVYMWKTEYNETPMLYATIPCFGASDYTNPWFGVPVQWNGLAYGYSLLMLSQYNSSFPWKTIATGILGSAMWQQMMTSPYPGTLPDHITNTAPQAPFIIPSQIVYCDLFLMGLNPSLNSATLGSRRDNVTVSTPAEILSGAYNGKSVTLTLSSNASDYVVISDFEASSVELYFDGSVVQLAQRSELRSSPSGWYNLGGSTVIKLSYPAREIAVTVTGQPRPV